MFSDVHLIVRNLEGDGFQLVVDVRFWRFLAEGVSCWIRDVQDEAGNGAGHFLKIYQESKSVLCDAFIDEKVSSNAALAREDRPSCGQQRRSSGASTVTFIARISQERLVERIGEIFAAVVVEVSVVFCRTPERCDSNKIASEPTFFDDSETLRVHT